MLAWPDSLLVSLIGGKATVSPNKFFFSPACTHCLPLLRSIFFFSNNDAQLDALIQLVLQHSCKLSMVHLFLFIYTRGPVQSCLTVDARA